VVVTRWGSDGFGSLHDGVLFKAIMQGSTMAPCRPKSGGPPPGSCRSARLPDEQRRVNSIGPFAPKNDAIAAIAAHQFCSSVGPALFRGLEL
jgi:hypothetical protein